MKKLVFLFWVIATTLHAQSILAPQVKWQFIKNDSIHGPSYGVVETNNKHFVIVFRNSINEYLLEEIDSTGNIFWQTFLGGLGNSFFNLKDTPDGYIVCGSKTSGNQRLIVIKTDKNGNILWNHNYGSSSNYLAPSIDIVGDSYIVSGTRKTGTNSYSQRNSFLMKIDSIGTMLWYKNHYLDSSATLYHSINLGLVGKVVVLNNGFGQLIRLKYNTTLGYNSRTGEDFFLKTNAAGDSVYSYHFSDTFKPTSFTKSKIDGSFMFVGLNSTDTLSLHSYSTVKLDSNGLFLSRKNFNLSVENGGFGNIVAKNNSGFVAFGVLGGYGPEVNSDYCSFVMRITEDGDTLWTKKIGGVPGHSFVSTSSCLTADGGCVIAGIEQDSLASVDWRTLFLKLGPDSLDLQISVNTSEHESFGWSIYPNPSLGEVTLKLKNFTGKEDINFSLYDIAGKLLMSRKVQDEKNVFSFEGLSPGCYFYEIKNHENNKSGTGKLILMK
ncbi:MAG: T9SS type A sorting domain-containing protein [Minisyncoccia bacterium]